MERGSWGGIPVLTHDVISGAPGLLSLSIACSGQAAYFWGSLRSRSGGLEGVTL